MIELKNIDKIYNKGTVNELQLFKSFNFKVEKEQFVSVIGSNGSGKTTMLNIICGSIPFDGGDIIINNSSIKKLKEFQRYIKIGRVYQNPAMGTCANMTILENMSLADNKGKTYGLSLGTNSKRINYYKEQLSQLNLGLEDKLHVKVGLLSGGQRQAMSLLMSVMTDIDILILDEHTAALDPKTAEIIMEITNKVVKEKKLTTLMVTHNLLHAVNYGDRIVLMHEGKCVLDKAGKDKENTQINEILNLFNTISLERGNKV